MHTIRHGCWDRRTARSRERPGSGGTGSWSTAPTPAAGCRWSSTRSARGSWPARCTSTPALGDDFDPATLPAMAEGYGAKVDFEGTAAVIERHGLRF